MPRSRNVKDISRVKTPDEELSELAISLGIPRRELIGILLDIYFMRSRGLDVLIKQVATVLREEDNEKIICKLEVLAELLNFYFNEDDTHIPALLFS